MDCRSCRSRARRPLLKTATIPRKRRTTTRTAASPRSPGTAYVLLHHYMGELDGVFRAWGFAKGGNGSVSAAIAAAAQAHGADIRTQAPVAKILVAGERAAGVVLDGGEELRAPIVVSGADPRRTFLGLVGEAHLPNDFVSA